MIYFGKWEKSCQDEERRSLELKSSRKEISTIKGWDGMEGQLEAGERDSEILVG